LAANRRVEIVVLARVDNTAGRAVAQLGNTTATGTDGTGSAQAVPDPGTPAEPSPVPSSNLLAPEPDGATSTLLAPDPTGTTKATARGSASPSAARTATEHSG